MPAFNISFFGSTGQGDQAAVTVTDPFLHYLRWSVECYTQQIPQAADAAAGAGAKSSSESGKPGKKKPAETTRTTVTVTLMCPTAMIDEGRFKLRITNIGGHSGRRIRPQGDSVDSADVNIEGQWDDQNHTWTFHTDARTQDMIILTVENTQLPHFTLYGDE